MLVKSSNKCCLVKVYFYLITYILVFIFTKVDSISSYYTSNIQLSNYNLNNIKLNNNSTIKQECNPKCNSNFGMCYNNQCYCLDNYVGSDCSVIIKSKGYRINLFTLFIFFLLFILIGLLLGYIVFLIIDKYCFKKRTKSLNIGEIDLFETWEKNNQE